MPVQVPLWVTYTLAAIAILGPIGGALLGALLTARRDDRRWSLEREREDLRWQRERGHELLVAWREPRSSAYSATYQALCAIFSIWHDARDGEGLPPTSKVKLSSYLHNLIDGLAELSVFATRDVIEKATDLQFKLMFLNTITVNGFNIKSHRLRMNEIRPLLGNLLNAMRADLGVDQLEDAHLALTMDTISPAQPPAPAT